MKIKFWKADYQEAKAFLKDAVEISRADTSTFSATTYRKPDGSEWIEFDSKLEAPEDGYTLELKK